MSSNPDVSPVNPLPPVIVALAGAMFLIELAFNLGARGLIGGPQAVGWRIAMMQEYAPSGLLIDRMIEVGRYPPEILLRFMTYPFLHVNFTHMLFAVVILLAMGKFVGEVFRWWALLLVFFAAAIVGAVVYGLFVDSRVALVGAYPGDYGLIGAFTFLLWVNLAAQGANKYRAFTLIGFLLFIKLVFGLLFGGGQDWIADLAGFATGFGLSFVVSPGGFSRALAQVRRRG
ncbi:rhomboid family intramembrane serine protease [Profundibacter amoris]|uniref:Rhomboid family intramembrane serine protease n=1 Tax=Profundibacter amoris TaxID=2171755 RepID=A0A347UJU8_9RHOB|nr:rhomboid family intramembrane serine protease [Profundibacter amoris]AXX99126.1 rhomboid family intramembrane serine protease [Profundibacter amoris]